MSTPTTPEPLDPSLFITLPSFEGPLDLLLHLIRKHELDILDLPIAFVTERYLEYVTMMEKLDLDIASEYLVMAATLAHIKSKMLLPQEPDDQADDEVLEDEVDPRAELIRRLLEYQKYKDAAEKLGSRGIAGRDVFVRGSDAPEASGPPALAPTSLFKLLDAFQAVLARAQADLAFEITAEGISIQDRMRQLTELLREKREITFEELFEGQVTIYDLVITFMAILEMAKRRLLRIFQADPHSPIHLKSTVVDEEMEEGALDFDSDPAWAPADAHSPSEEEEPQPDGERALDVEPEDEPGAGAAGASTEAGGSPPPGSEPAVPGPYEPASDRVEVDFGAEPDSGGPDEDFDAALESGALDFEVRADEDPSWSPELDRDVGADADAPAAEPAEAEPAGEADESSARQPGSATSGARPDGDGSSDEDERA